MITEIVKLTQIQVNEANPRSITDTKFEKLINSILVLPKMLEIRPIVVDNTFVALGGNMRFRALTAIADMDEAELKARLSDTRDFQKKTAAEQDNLIDYWLRWKDKPTAQIIKATQLTEAEQREFIIKDNVGFGDWDMDALANEWDAEELDDWGLDVWQDNQTPSDDVKEDDFSEEEDAVEKRCERGDVWQLGDHRLMCGDSKSIADVERLMNGEKADMVLSDPPYGMCLVPDFSSCVGSANSIGGKRNIKGGKYNAIIGDNEDFHPDLINTFFVNFAYVKEMFLFGADYFAELLLNKNNGSWLVWDKRKEGQEDAIGSEFELIWSKNKHKRRMLRFDWFGFASSKDAKDAKNRVHPTQKPVSLLIEIINQWGNNSKKIVDLYGGSGSTLIACEQTRRRCFMMELDEHYCDVIIARWEKETGQTAVKIV